MSEEDTFDALRRIPAQQAFQQYLTWCRSGGGRGLLRPLPAARDAFIKSLGWTWSELHEALK